MTNPMFNPQPNYSGVTIQITNPAVYSGQCDGKAVPCVNGGQVCSNMNPQSAQNCYINYPQASYASYPVNNVPETNNLGRSDFNPNNSQQMANPVQNTGYPNAYPAQYYLNNYNYNGTTAGGKDSFNDINNKQTDRIVNNKSEKQEANTTRIFEQKSVNDNNKVQENYNGANAYQIYADSDKQKNNDLTKSQGIIGDIAEREAAIQEEKKNTKETKIVALTDEYIKSLENYLNNPNDEIRLMASKEILTRLDEDKDRYDDAALNALLNKMMQDPNKLVRIAALSAFSSQLASGNDYTVKLLHNIQSNPNADKEDVLQAADILLKMSAGVEVKNIPNPSVKEKQQ